MLQRMILCAALAALTTGCLGTLKPGYDVSRHAIYVGENGEGLAALPEREALAADRPAARAMSDAELRQAVGRLMNEIRESPLDTVTLFIHGGLVSHRGGYNKAVGLGPALAKAGHFPLFVIWEAGWGPTLADHLKSIRQGQEWHWLPGWGSAPFMIAADVSKGFSRMPFGTIQQLGDYCARLKGLLADSLEKAVGAHECGLVSRVAVAEQQRGIELALAKMDDPLQLGLGVYRGTVASAVARTTVGAATLAPKFFLSGPLIDGFGGGTWNNMLRRTQTMFHRGEEMTIGAAGKSGYIAPRGAVSVLIDSLQSLLGENRDGRAGRRSFILAGHSMGTIVAARILRQWPRLPIDRIYFMAAAATVGEVESSVVPFLSDTAHAQTRFYNGMLHPRVESGEWQLKALDLVPRGTLLEWIDDALSSPNTPLERTAGKWTNMAAMSYMFPVPVRSRITLKGFGYRDPQENGFRYAGLNSHGSFSNPGFEFWRDSTWIVRPIPRTPPTTGPSPASSTHP